MDNQYYAQLKESLEKYLNRPAKKEELINADQDSNMVTEVLWQLIVKLEKRVENLENGKIKI